MTDRILALIKEYGISLAAPIAVKDCNVLRRYKLEKAGFSDLDGNFDGLFAVILAIPYLTPQKKRNLSAYAAPRDYHGYFKELFSSLIPRLEEEFHGYRFAGFADDSPIAERDAAAKAGLGIIGDNGMLITEKYSSYVFLGEIVTDLPLECETFEIRRCQGCGVCKRACPMSEIGECLSALTQKKGELSEKEAAAIEKYGSVWGCDICQEVCPHTLRAIKNGTIYTDVEYFKESTVGHLSREILDGMTDGEFAERAYSWRGRKTIERNLGIVENKK